MAELNRRTAEYQANEPCLGKFGKVGSHIIDIANINNESPFVTKIISTTQKHVVGLLIQRGDQSVVLDSKSDNPSESIYQAEQNFVRILAKLPFEIVDGTLQVEIDGVRKLCREVGIFEDLERAPGRLVLPQRFHVPKVETLASKDDSFGKSKWRAELKDFAKETFAEKKIDPKNARALIFGGLGEEIDLWRSFGIEEENIYSIEEDFYIAEEQARRFPNVQIFRHNFEGNIIRFRQFVSNHPRDHGRSSFPDRTNFNVVNLDPESKLTPKFVDTMRNITIGGGIFAYNFYMKRESEAIRRFYESISRHVQKDHYDNGFKPDMDLDGLRKKAIESLVDYVKCPRKACGIKGYKPPKRAMKTHCGDYEAAGGGKMMYAMHQI